MRNFIDVLIAAWTRITSSLKIPGVIIAGIQAALGAVVYPGKDDRPCQHSDQVRKRLPFPRVRHQLGEMPQVPDEAHKECSPKCAVVALHPGKGEATPARFLEQPDDHRCRDQGDEEPTPVGIGAPIRRRATGDHHGSRRKAGQDERAQDRDQVPQGVDTPTAELLHQRAYA